ncbi:Glutathione hydrolase-like YwrD proenzyme [Streptomyces sp. RB17]|uniref:gamma-glutamyltransferase family protein n=1 Tax=Streptomyces sp. RB17 TaxID=2585197 RepID=UPI00130A042D|nr:gamma-glutamyltransferase [Streptomyces sp. RB17]MQY33694.1 Glutathione hydrolase-like YwrD proenzyme [Streptomyces sp. RB17]
MLFRPELRGTRGAVASTHWLASAAGFRMYDKGGNAFDAAVAAAFVIQVVEPHLNGPGGDVPVLAHRAGSGQVDVVCGQGPMPRAATIERFEDLGLSVIPGSGLLPAVVPGAFGAWLRVLAEYGTLRLEDVLEPAVGYAEHGYPLLPKAAEMIRAMQDLFRDEWTESARTYLVGGVAPRPGSRMTNPDLARTYRRILDEARAAGADRDKQIDAAVRAFYEGFVAEAVDHYLATAEEIDATGRRHRGLLTGADMAGWRPTVEPSLSLRHGALTVHKAGPWSQGPVFLQQLALLQGFDLAGTGPHSADFLHCVTEAAKLAFADREAWYGDPAHAQVPMDALLDPDYTAARRALIGREASGELRPGSPGGRAPVLPPIHDESAGPAGPAWLGELEEGIPAVLRSTAARGDTCCVTAVDARGNMVVATPSGGWLKSSPVVPGLGFPLGTRGQMATLTRGHANALAPGKRPRTTLSPTLVLREGRPLLAFGTPGGDQQDQWTLEFFLRYAEHGMGVQEAVEARTFHTDHVPTSFTPRRFAPGTLVVEEGMPVETIEELRRRGHTVRTVADYTLSKVCATGMSRDDMVIAAASPRGAQAYAVAD